MKKIALVSVLVVVVGLFGLPAEAAVSGPGVYKTQDDATVYFVDEINVRHAVTSAEAFVERGFVWSNIKTVQPSELTELPAGDVILSSHEIKRDALINAGLKFLNKPEDVKAYSLVWGTLNRFNQYEGFRFWFNVEFTKNNIACGYHSEEINLACYHFNQRRLELVENPSNVYDFERAVFTEYAHTIGILDQCKANQFADLYLIETGKTQCEE